MHTFVVYAPDKTDEGAVERRFSVRPKHLEGARERHAQGITKIGGAMLTPESLVEGAEKRMTGSIMIIEAEDMAGARKIIEGDIYYTAGVWDPEKLVISPLVIAKLD